MILAAARKLELGKECAETNFRYVTAEILRFPRFCPRLKSPDGSPITKCAQMELSVEQTLPPSSLLTTGESSPAVKKSLTSQQWISLVLLSLGNFGLAVCSGLQAPFFPREAEMKGCTPAEYGLVFGLFYLTTFIFSPIFGKLLSIVGPDQLRDLGMFIVGVCFVLFGFLDRSPPGTTFLVLAYLVRIVEGIGSAAYKTSNFAIVAAFFPNNMASIMGVLETMYGMGLIVGPTAGGLLYELGGYTLPFVLSGSSLVLICFLTICLLPKTEVTIHEKKKGNMLRFIMDPLVIFYICLLTVGAMMVGFNTATLEPHLRQFHLSAVQIGLVFVFSGGFYGISSIVWGRLADKKFNPTMMTCLASLFLAISFAFIGPAPILPFDSYLWLVAVSLVLLGCGFGATRVIPFVDCLRSGIDRGFENTMATYGMVSGVFNGAFGIGFFLGPTVGGISMEVIGYRWSSFFLSIIAFVLFLCFVCHLTYESRRKKKKKQRDENDPLLRENGFCPGSRSSGGKSSARPDSAF